MAHADYNCCANCDRKMEYSHDPLTKELMCPECAVTLMQLTGEKLTDGKLFLAWIEKTPSEQLKPILVKSGYKACYYPNDIDLQVLGEEKHLEIYGATFYKNDGVSRTDLPKDRMIKE